MLSSRATRHLLASVASRSRSKASIAAASLLTVDDTPSTSSLPRRQTTTTYTRSYASTRVVSATSDTNKNFPNPERTEKFQQLGLLDEQGLTVFETLHEMQSNSCRVFSDNELFGTFNPETKQFEYMTYAQYDDNVEACRLVLQDLGTSDKRTQRTRTFV